MSILLKNPYINKITLVNLDQKRWGLDWYLLDVLSNKQLIDYE
jgi:hypothetical protein